MMYDELIKNLRICSRCDFDQNCNGCTQDSKDPFCCAILLRNAADAIEDLSKTLDEEVEINTALEYNMPVWIPVTERLPKYMKNVLVTDGIDVGMGWYDFYKRRDTGIIDQYWCTPNCDVDSDNVKYWAEMPSPPEREDK